MNEKVLPAFKCLPVQFKDSRGRFIEIRRLESKDFRALCAMYDAFEPKGLECGLPPPNKDVRLKWLHYVVSELFSVVGVHGNRIIGHAALSLSCSPTCPEFLIFIQKGFRNHGIGTALCTVMKKAAKEAGCEKVVVTVRTANIRAVKVFKKVGFSFCGDINACRDMELLITSGKVSHRKSCNAKEKKT